MSGWQDGFQNDRMSDRVTKCPSDQETEWPSDQVTQWLSDRVNEWPSDRVTMWPSQSWIVRQSVNSSTQRGVPGARSRLPRLPGAKLSISYNSVLSLKNRYERVSSSSNLKQRIDMRGYLAAAARKKFLHRNCPRQFVKAIPQHPPPPPTTAPSDIRNQLSSAVSWNISRAVSFSSH